MDSKRWLSLSEAAERLDVHPTTLRRWANAGAIAVLITPGGHRRFDIDEIERFASKQQAPRSDYESIWAREAIEHTRQEIVSQPQQRWLQAPSDQARLQLRALGQQLVGLAMQFMATEEEDPDLLQQAQQIGRQYAALSRATNMGLTEALGASIFFHEQLLETSLLLPQNARVRPETSQRVLRRINKLLNTVHLAIAAAYEEQ